ncbi:MAG: GxxExxY protein [Prevotella sp.]|nr:GxxExxY protein [Prevotella sp.]
MDISYLKKYIYDVIGAIHEVHKELGAGLNEFCYQEGLELQLSEQMIDFEREKTFHPLYHGKVMSALYRLDFLCKSNIIVECKAVAELTNVHRSQLFNYLRLTKFPCGILVNFAPRFATIERYFYDKELGEVLTVNGSIVKTL